MTDLTVANTIKRQLCGNRSLSLMLGTKYLLGTDDSLIFDFKMCRRAQKCVIRLDPSDTYTMTFYVFKRVDGIRDAIETESFSWLYADQLADVFTSYTGLYLSL